MKMNGFHASTSGGKKVMAVSLILALVLASISVIAAFAAPGSKSKSAFGNQLTELNFDRAWFNSARLNAANFVRTSDPGKAQQYLSQYAFALGQAEAIVAGRGTNTTNNNNNSNNSSTNNSSNFGSAQSNLAGWLHMMRGLRDKLATIGFTANVGNINNVAGAGVPVTGGTSNNSNNGTSNNGTSNSSSATATPGTGSSSSAGAATSTATPTATPGTGSSSSSGTGTSSATPTATPGTGSSSNSGTGSSSNSGTGTASNSNNGNAGIPNTGNQNSTFLSTNRSNLMKVWGHQFNELEFDIAWFNNFKSNPKNFNTTDPAKTQQWMDQYTFALRQAEAIITGRGTNVSNNNNNNNNQSNNGSSVSNNSSSNNSGFGSAQSQLGQWLHMMSGLRDKLTGVNGTNSSSSTSGSTGG